MRNPQKTYPYFQNIAIAAPPQLIKAKKNAKIAPSIATPPFKNLHYTARFFAMRQCTGIITLKKPHITRAIRSIQFFEAIISAAAVPTVKKANKNPINHNILQILYFKKFFSKMPKFCRRTNVAHPKLIIQQT